MHTVKQLAKASGVSVRTLHHYHAIGLLVPAEVGASNGYRYYGRAELLRLQQILFFRELGFGLAAIAAILDAPGFDLKAALVEHRRCFEERLGTLHRLIRTIDRTVATLDEEQPMKTDTLFDGFDAAKQAAYEAEVTQRWGAPAAEAIEHSKHAMARRTAQDTSAFVAELGDIEAALVEAMASGDAPQSARLHALLRRHHAWVARSWPRPPDATAYAGLADLYRSHRDFIARYEAMRPGFAAWLADAMHAYARMHLTGTP